MAQTFYDRENKAPPPKGAWNVGWHSEQQTGIRYSLSNAADIDKQLSWLLTCRPAYLFAFSSILKELAVAVQKRGIQFRLAAIVSGSTVLDEKTRALCRSAFGAEIADMYASEEVGVIATQCRECGEYHIAAEANVVEVLRDDGSAAESGEIGRVVATPLYNYAMPLIRYAIGDMAEVGAAVPSCGRGLPTLRCILGRYRNMFRFRDGIVLWPSVADMRVHDFILLKQLQLVQADFDRVEIRDVPQAPDQPVDLPALRERVRASLNQPVEVVLCPVERIERSRNGKYEDCISLLPTS